MSLEKQREYKNFLENVIDWAKRCLEVLRFQKAWQKGQIPEAEMAGPIRTSEEEQKMVEEIFNPSSTFPTKKKPRSGFDIHSIEIEVYGPKKVEDPPEPEKTSVPSEPVEATSPEPVTEPVAPKAQTDMLLPAETPKEGVPNPQSPSPKRDPETSSPTVPAPSTNVTKEPSLPPVQAPVPRTDSDKPYLLVIDDYEPLLNMLSRSLKSAGYEPVCAKDGVEGIVKLHEYAVDLIISDVQMPKLDGFDLSKMLNVREETRDIPVIFLTEVLDDQTRTIAKRLGAADTIIKPFTMDTLLDSVKTVLACHRAVEESTELEAASVS